MQRQDIITLRGGLDLVSQPMNVAPGYCIGAQNYESEVRGYRRMEGWERFDGQPKPSLGIYWILNFDSGSTAIAEGDLITGDTSGATAIALQDATVSSGSWVGGDAAGEIVLYNVTGTFEDNEGLEVSASNVATTDGTALERAESVEATSQAYIQAAIEKRRTAIAAVPGTGDILGVCAYAGDVYAFRNHSGGTYAQMYKATNSGWALQSFGHTLDFTAGGTAEMEEGETITGGTSGATATVERIIRQSGGWSGTAAGYLVLSGITGTFQAAETITGGTSGSTATAGGAQAAITLPPGGRYRTINHNFYGLSNLNRLYFVNGVGYAHEWDGTVLAPIRTGASASLDKPTFVGVHSNHLLLGYNGGSIQGSGTGLPLSFVSTDGAFEFGFGEDLTGLKSNTKTSTVITGRNRIGYLIGTDKTNMELSEVSEDSGAKADTMEVIGDVHFLDDQGVRSLRTSDQFGDWNIGTVTQMVEPSIQGKRTITPIGVLRVRAKNQYRIFWEDRTGMVIYFGRQNPEVMPFVLNFDPTCVASAEDSDGNEILLIGSDTGMVYQMDSGTSADDEEFNAFIRFPFMHQGAPNQIKRYHRAQIDVADAGGGNTLYYSTSFGYGDPDLPAGSETSISFFGGGGFWDTSFWDLFYWDSMLQSSAWAELDGIGTNMSLVIMSDSTYEAPHTLAALSINYTPRRRLR